MSLQHSSHQDRTSMRACEICTDIPRQLLHRQAFLIPGVNKTSYYNVVCCERCGFVYADDIPSQAEQDAYYEASGRHLHATSVPPGLSAAHRAFFDFIIASNPELNTDSAILDVGSSMGHFLNLFKTAGYSELLGLEPSGMASQLAQSTYGIEVVPRALDNFKPARHFDLITLCGVLEHLVSLKDTVKQISRLLANTGRLFIAVPDAASFGEREPREPFLEFALEHINFFTERSLDNLMRPHGFRLLASTSQWNDFYGNRYLLALYEHDEEKTSPTKRDETGPDSVRRYIELSNSRLNTVSRQIGTLADSREPLIVWGAGSLASRLCVTTRLPECNLLAFVDANPQLHGKALLGKPIYAPVWIDQHREATILIASYVYGTEIRNKLIEEFHWSGSIAVI